jgi:transcription-repair coupling factor (superfamily II helicase)
MPMRRVVIDIVPEFTLRIVHGKMPVAVADQAVLEFAEGQGDILLTTDIIENGLDIPRANTIFVWGADRSGLIQLHQLRGRVGRGRARGIAYLMTDPAAKLRPAAKTRLNVIADIDRPGGGLEISARDLDLRGAGDLFGEDQAGHIKFIGVALFQHLLERTVRLARGEKLNEEWTPDITIPDAGDEAQLQTAIEPRVCEHLERALRVSVHITNLGNQSKRWR